LIFWKEKSHKIIFDIKKGANVLKKHLRKEMHW
jgi:hypothetical protein